jgi:hypothetical protein
MHKNEDRLLIALKRLAESADGYIDDGSWCDALVQDLTEAHRLINEILEAKGHQKVIKKGAIK